MTIPPFEWTTPFSNSCSRKFALTSGFLLIWFLVSTNHANAQNGNLDDTLRILLEQNGVGVLDPGPAHEQAKIGLGQALFFDRELSGSRDTSCATCHHPKLATGDMLALPVGMAPVNPGAIGHERIKGPDREFIPRNAPEVFNRGSVLWTSQFWDSRIADDGQGQLITPAGSQILPGLESVLAAQAMFPVTSRDEMRGRDGDLDVFGYVNEIAQVPDDDLQGMWSALVDRLMALGGYQQLFADAYPGKSMSEYTFVDAANAIAAFESSAFTFLDSPFDQYIAGNSSALSKKQKRGAILFYGKAGCASCHSGTLMTDQQHHGLAVPQLGPGKAAHAPRDVGRYLETGNLEDLFAFRTPPLRNVAETGPWMHNGAYSDLRRVIRHHANPIFHLWTYRPKRQLAQKELWETVLTDPMTRFLLMYSMDIQPKLLSNREVKQIEAFLNSLTCPDFSQRMESTIPDSVPSGLPIDGEDP